MIIFDSIQKTFTSLGGGLREASFKIDNNEFVFLTGPSGAGKTTILRLILRQIMPNSGSITVDDFEITKNNFNQTVELRRHIGMVFQDFKILPEKNVFENIALSLQVIKTPREQITDAVMEVLSLVGLSEKKLMFPSQLSAGELQRVAIARAVVGERTIILADEPTGNLDPKTSWEIMKLFKKLEGSRTIIIATHNVDIVNSFKKRVISLKDGRIIRDKHKGGYEL